MSGTTDLPHSVGYTLTNHPKGYHEYILDGNVFVALTDQRLDPSATMGRVRNVGAGANVLFAGTTRNYFDGRPVSHLQYAAYRPRALHTLRTIATEVCREHGLTAMAVEHRLGPVPVGADSLMIAVSAPHRAAAWSGAEACLEEVKARVEIWKQEVFLPTRLPARYVAVRGDEHGGEQEGEGEGQGEGQDEGQGEGEGEGQVEGEKVWRANAEATEPPRPNGV